MRVIGDAAFSGDNVLNIGIDPANEHFLNQGGMLTDRNGKLISACSGKTIPDTVTEIGQGAFMESNIDQVTFPESVKKMGSFAFAGSMLREINWNSQIEEIPECAFYCCENIIYIEIPSNVKVVGDYAFVAHHYKKKIKAIVLNEGVEQIGFSAFACWAGYGFDRIILPESLKVVRHWAFNDCRDFRLFARASKAPEGWWFNHKSYENASILSGIIFNYKGPDLSEEQKTKLKEEEGSDTDDCNTPEMLINSLGSVHFGPYEWQILGRNDNSELLIAKNPVAEKPYHEILQDRTWETCSLRAWLNHEFLEQFSEIDRNRILKTLVHNPDNQTFGTPGGNDTEDKVFLLSSEEAEKYFKNNGRSFSKYWWLRSPGDRVYFAACLLDNGEINDEGTPMDAAIGVRPAMWVKLDE